MEKWLSASAYKAFDISQTAEDTANVTINCLVTDEVSIGAKMYDLE